MLTPLTTVLSQALEWRQPSSMRRDYVLQSADGPCARIACSWWRFLGEGETADGRWRLTHGVFWRSSPRAEDAAGGAVATFRRRFFRRAGSLHLGDGRDYAYRAEGFLRQILVVSYSDGREILRVERMWRAFRCESRVTFGLAAGECPDLSLLVVLSWYAMLLFTQRRMAVAAAVPG